MRRHRKTGRDYYFKKGKEIYSQQRKHLPLHAKDDFMTQMTVYATLPQGI